MGGLDPLPYVARGGQKAAMYYAMDLWWFFIIQQPKYILTYIYAMFKIAIVVFYNLWPKATEGSVIRFVEGTTLGESIHTSFLNLYRLFLGRLLDILPALNACINRKSARFEIRRFSCFLCGGSACDFTLLKPAISSPPAHRFSVK